MGFNKRFVTEEIIKKTLENNLSISKLFESDAIIFMDDVSNEVFKMVNKGISETEIKTTIYGRFPNN